MKDWIQRVIFYLPAVLLLLLASRTQGQLTRERRSLLWDGQPIHLVGYSYYGLAADRTFDTDVFLETIAAHNINYTRFFLILPWPAEPGPNVLPFAKVEGKYDLHQFNPAFFDRLRRMVKRAEELGIICQVCLFDRCGLSIRDKLAWDNNPYNPACNVNGLLQGDNGGYPPFCQTEGEIAKINAAFIQKVVETIGDCDNVLYEIMNEPYRELGDLESWHGWAARLLHDHLTGRSGSKLISSTGPYQNELIDVFSMHMAGSERHVDAAIRQSIELNKPIILSDDGDMVCMYNPAVTQMAAERARALGQHFEHLEFSIANQREIEKRPASYYYQLPGLCQTNLRLLSRLSQALLKRPYISEAAIQRKSGKGIFSARIENVELAQRIFGEQSLDGGRNWLPLAVEVHGAKVQSKNVSLSEEDRILVRVVCLDRQSRRWPGPILATAPVNGWTIRLGETLVENGIFRCRPNHPDGVVRAAKVGGKACQQIALKQRGKYAYFRLEDSFPRGKVTGPVIIEVEYYDESAGARLLLEYDSLAHPYTAAAPMILEGSGSWKIAEFTLPDARFLGGQNDGADFRFSLQDSNTALALRSVTVRVSVNPIRK